MSANSPVTADRRASQTSLRDGLLFALTVSSGAVDAISFLALGKVFTAFMTGNIAFLGLAIAQDPRAPTITSVVTAMAGFAIGVYIGTRIVVSSEQSAMHQLNDSFGLVWSRRTTYALSVSLLGHLCFLAIWLAAAGEPSPPATLALLAVWALAMGMQSASARRLEVGGIFTTAATATFIFLVGGFAGEPLAAKERGRLIGVLASLMLGATAGGLLLVHAPIYAPVLPFVITIAVVVTAARCFPASITTT